MFYTNSDWLKAIAENQGLYHKFQFSLCGKRSDKLIVATMFHMYYCT